jgi:hypothetical protein
MDGSPQLCLCSIPASCRLEWDVLGGVVNYCEGAHPEVVAKPGYQPELQEATNSRDGNYRRKSDHDESSNSCQTDHHLAVTTTIIVIVIHSRSMSDRKKCNYQPPLGTSPVDEV